MRTRGIKALAAAASLAVLAMATQASATATFNITNVSMDNYTYQADVAGFGWALDNGVTFTVSGYPTGETSLYGFCIDIFHDISLGGNYTYSTNQPLPDDGGLNPNSKTTLVNAGDANPLNPLNQISDITNLVDTGWLIKKHETAQNQADSDARIAAIQAAIWDVAVPGSVLGLAGGNTALLEHYFTYYTSSSYHTLAKPGDKVFTISNGDNQSFAIGWPVNGGVPEPATWAMMLTGFFGMGSVLRRNRKAAAVTA